MKKTVMFGLLALALSVAPGHAAGLKLSIHEGTVSIDAQDVTIRQILAEWARLGKTKIVNLEGVTSGPITLKLDNVPEKSALDIILRSLPGYVAATRASYDADASLYDRILLMTTTTAVASASRTQTPTPAFQGTQLRPGGQFPTPAVMPDPADLAADQMDDQALAAAAAAGLIAVPGPMPGTGLIQRGFPQGAPQVPFGFQPPAQPSPPASTPATAAPTNSFNVPAATPMPGLAPPPAAAQPPTPIRPPLPDR